MFYPKQSFSLLSSFLCITLALTACQKNDTATANMTISTEKAEKQEITMNNGTEPASLDPHKVGGVPESNILRQLLMGLTTSDKNGHTVAGLAEKWESKDLKTWIFHLRDAKWSNGDPISADDFVYSFRRLVDPKTAASEASYLADAKIVNAQNIIDGKAAPETLGVKALDTKTLEITLHDPVPYLPDMMMRSLTFAVNKKAIEQYGDKWTSPEHFVSSGAYKLKDWQVNNKIVLERNPNYFDNAQTNINQITFLPISSANTDINHFKAGELDLTNNDIPSEQYANIKQEMGAQLHTGPYLCSYYYELNHTKPPFNDVRVRKALSLAFDREIFTQKIVGRGERPAYQFTPTATQGMKNFEPEWKSWDMNKRVEEAKKLLTEAGYSATHPLKFELLYNTNENHKRNATAIAALWKEKLGFVEINLNNQEWKTFFDTRLNHKFQMANQSVELLNCNKF